MKVLIACEFSGIVRDAFIAKGHTAESCDLLKTEKPNWTYDPFTEIRTHHPDRGHHFVMDIFDLLSYGSDWDLLIAFPPCTHLAVSGARWFKEKQKDGRQQKAIGFFMRLANTNIPKIAIENPVGIMSTKWRKPDQIIQPWQFGHDASKKTCLWLKGLPRLKPTKIIKKETYANQTPSGQNKLGPSEDRAKIRSITYQGIADAMANQWG